MTIRKAFLALVIPGLIACDGPSGDTGPADATPVVTATEAGVFWSSAGATLSIRWIGRSVGGVPEPLDGDGSFEVAWEGGRRWLELECFATAAGTLQVFHLRGNPPGDLEFEVRWRRPGEVVGRRLLVEGESRAWVFPMESDVATVNGGIEVRGEGEALVVAGFGEQAVDAMHGLGVEGDRVDDVLELLSRLEARRE